MPDGPWLTAEKRAPRDGEIDGLMAVAPKVGWPPSPTSLTVERRDVTGMRILIAFGVVSIAAFLFWFFHEDRVGAPLLYWPLTGVLLFKLSLTLYEWFCYAAVEPREPAMPAHSPSVDIFTTWCPGEPREMVVATLKTLQAVTYPHTTYLCDEGDDPLLRRACAELGVVHVTRDGREGAKAGNINNALRRSTGEICVIVDPDHEAAPYFLDRLIGYFANPAVGFVQSVQGYHNQDASLIARGAAEQTYHFYGPIMTGMHGHGTTQAIGANCAFRRSALDSIGGHATGLAEDMHTTIRLYAKGWKSVYVPEVLTRGQVPETLSAYSKQQLKWACGVWDILIETYCSVLGRLSWRNRAHYLFNAVFYLRGLAVPVACLVPVIALFTGLVPWRIGIVEFLLWFGPVLAAQVLVRQFAQRWLLGPEERGFHLVGGCLLAASWWIHLLGMTCSILRVRIPYIPTPKDNKLEDAWWLAAPCFAISILSVTAAIWGLNWDWSPYSLLMAGFALVNAASFGFIAIVAQQQSLGRFANFARLEALGDAMGAVLRCMVQGLCWPLRSHGLALAVVATISGASASVLLPEEVALSEFWARIEGRADRDYGAFLLGLYEPVADLAAVRQRTSTDAIESIGTFETATGAPVNVVSFYHSWGPASLEAFPDQFLADIRRRGAVPMITWEPWTATFQYADADLARNRRVFRKILDGWFDKYLAAYAAKIRDFGSPVMIRFAHEMDNPQYPWSAAGGNDAESFRAAWRYVVEFFNGMGATNVAWVWSPWKAASMEQFYPGDVYVDWIGLTLLNYGDASEKGTWNGFSDLYAPFAARTRQWNKPVLLAEFGSTALGGDRETWISDALHAMAAGHPEIRGVVFFHSGRDTNWPTGGPPAGASDAIDWRFVEGRRPVPMRVRTSMDTLVRTKQPRLLPAGVATNEPVAAPRVAGVSGRWRLEVDGKPFYVRGVAYGVGQGWRAQGSNPTRQVLERDFARIAAMGANTVRRYASDWSDRNVLNAAENHGLKVLFGFWLDENVDFMADADKLARIESKVVATVRRLHSHPAVLGWNLGNETWGLIKHKYGKPHLSKMRDAYVTFVERLARRIKEIDPAKPVFTSLEFSAELPGALAAFTRHAPSVDVLAVNVFYDRHLAAVNGYISLVAFDRPYLISEFGPRGYWDQRETAWNRDGAALEPSDEDKARQYVSHWKRHIEPNAGRNVGGIAFSWSDRLEGSLTWFGLTDLEGRRKLAYYALRDIWTENPAGNRFAAPQEMSLDFAPAAAGLTPGKMIEARVSGDPWPPGTVVTWTLVSEGSFKPTGSVDTADGSRVARIRLPDRPGRYRLHVHAARGGDVTTLSRPISIRNPGR